MNTSLPPWTGWALHAALLVAAVGIVIFATTRWLSAGQVESRLDEVATRLTADTAADEAPEDEAQTHDNETPGGGDDGPRRGGPRGGGGGGNGALPDDDPGLAAVKRINDRHIFSQPPPQRFRNIRGVLGNAVLFQQGGLVEVGGSFDGATVVAVGGNWVKLEHEGEEITINVSGTGGRDGPGRRRNRARRGPSGPSAEAVQDDTGGADDAADAGPRRITKADIDPAKIAAKYGIPVEMVQAQLDSVSDEEFQEGLEELGDEVDDFLRD